METLKTGDVVRYKTGSPSLTVIDATDTTVRCGWFNWDSSYEEATINREYLIVIPETVSQMQH